MPARVVDIVREGVIQSWLEGSSFRAIASKYDISEGSVCNIIAEKKGQHGSDLLDLFRDLGVAMNKSGLTVQQCVDGHRNAMMLKKLGVEEIAFDGFIERLVKLYVNAGLGPENLAKQIDELHYFLERNGNLSGSASIPQICDKINMKQEEETRLRSDITVLESKKRDLGKEISKNQSEKFYLEGELGMAKEFKEKLKADGFQIDEIPHCIDLARIVKGSGYSVHEIKDRLCFMGELENSLVKFRIENTEEEAIHDQLLRENTELKEIKSRHSQRIRELEFLGQMGFGLPEFKQLYYILDEIAEAHGLPSKGNAAVKWFFENFQDHFYDYIHLGKAVQKRRSEVANLNEQRDIQLLALNMTPDMKRAVDSLLRMDIRRDDIEGIRRLIEQYRLSHSETSPVDNNGSTSTSGNSIPGNSDSESRHDRKNSGNPRSTRESADMNWAGKIEEKEDVALSDLNAQAFSDGYQNGNLGEEDDFSRSGNHLKQEGKQGRTEEEKATRLQSVVQTEVTPCYQNQDIENDEEVVSQSRQKAIRENDIIGFLQSFNNPSPSDSSAPKDSEKAEFDSVQCSADSNIINEYAWKATSAKYDLVSRLNPGNKLCAGKESKNLIASSQRPPIMPPTPPGLKQLRTGVFAKRHTRIEDSSQQDS